MSDEEDERSTTTMLPSYPQDWLAKAMQGSPPEPPVDAEVPGNISQLIVTTPTNPAFEDEMWGVKFHEGAAVLSSRKKHKYGYSLNRLAWLFQFDTPGKYEVEIVYDGETSVPTYGNAQAAKEAQAELARLRAELEQTQAELAALKESPHDDSADLHRGLDDRKSRKVAGRKSGGKAQP
jgi:hypothetical protein